MATIERKDINGDYCGIYARYVDEHGYPVKRTKVDHPYTYDGFVQERCGPNEAANNTVYTDRLLQWDYDKTRKLQVKHFKDPARGDPGGDNYTSRSAELIEAFLQEWMERSDLKVVLVMEYCNVSSGYPLWRIDYWTDPKITQEKVKAIEKEEEEKQTKQKS